MGTEENPRHRQERPASVPSLPHRRLSLRCRAPGR